MHELVAMFVGYEPPASRRKWRPPTPEQDQVQIDALKNALGMN